MPNGQPASTPEMTDAATTEQSVAASGSYDLLKQRLIEQGEALQQDVESLNAARIAAFGKSEQALLLRTRARTDNNCVARDIVRIGDLLLFGYNVTLGLRKETSVADVFALYRLDNDNPNEELANVSLAGSFLEDPRFVSDFRELYAYYKQAQLVQLRATQDKLLAAFRIGAQAHDMRVFRWHIERDGRLNYTDNRGERDIALPPIHDFEWAATTREDHVGGKHPHVNILDTVFIETINGDLTVKIENNTEIGHGIYSEPVEDRNQSLADADMAYAKLGALILLRVRPYRESVERFFVYNQRTQQVARIDAIGQSCIQLPEDHGVIFPGGYYLQSGEHKRFDLTEALIEQLRFKRTIRSPNGEDVLYVFYSQSSGQYALFGYNLINKTLSTPIVANGYARFADGRLLVFVAESGEPARVHAMQLWQTPYYSDEHAATTPRADGFFGRVGNAELVRGISDLTAISRALREQTPTRNAYEDLIRQCTRMQDAYFWLSEPEAGEVLSLLKRIAAGAQQTLDEFEKVSSVRRATAQAITQASQAQRALMTDIASMLWHRPDDFVQALERLRDQRGAVLSLRELRYADMPALDNLDAELASEQTRVGERALQFLANAQAFDSYKQDLTHIAENLPTHATTGDIDVAIGNLDAVTHALDLLTEQIGSLPGGDAVTRTAILDQIGSLYSEANRLRAAARLQRKTLGEQEATAEFGAQFKLFSQSVANAVDFADTPEKCDEALTRLLAQLEELEGRFVEQERFIADIAEKRESVYEALSARRQSLLEARQRRVHALGEAAERILDGVPRRVAQLTDPAAVQSYFAGDALLAKLHKLIAELRDTGADVAADELDTRLKTARDQALRSVRDRSELQGEDDNTLRLGRHVFTISKQPLNITLTPHQGRLAFHLTGTDYFAPTHDERLAALQPFWEQALVSETSALYRGEYLAGSLMQAVLSGNGPLAWPQLVDMCLVADDSSDALTECVRQYSTARYQEGYLKGVHDHDVVRMLPLLVRMQDGAGLLAFSPLERALANLFWHHHCYEADRERWLRGARSAAKIRQLFDHNDAEQALIEQLIKALPDCAAHFGLPSGHATLQRAATYLARQLATERGADEWVISAAGEDLALALNQQMELSGQLSDFHADLAKASPAERWSLACAWLKAYADKHGVSSAWLADAALKLIQSTQWLRTNIELDVTITGLLGEHARIDNGQLTLNLNDFWQRWWHHHSEVAPHFNALLSLRQELVNAEKTRLRLEQFQAKPLASFVRNRLIDEVYLPLVGDNLAKQLGATGAGNRTDRMGMLLLISPPGYGKTTLMEYIAERLGLVFVRINCPVLGHDITALDPASASHAAARQELQKLNLGLAMGSNVLLYLDDIQHTNPEFLQKFIALADGTRRIEGVWDGEPRTYDLRGKRFAVVMAGNPYTESGEAFRIPDMLANRADIYNLGDVLSGHQKAFALSYIENAVTSNPLLLPLASRDPADIQRLVRLAEGDDIPASEFSYNYGAAELDELRALLQRLFKARDALLKVNANYIASAAQQDAYRTEPPFKLQGSYRNMSKLAARITPLMDDGEMDALLRDHYRGEAQTLTTGAEENLLKLAHLLGRPSTDEQTRWTNICAEFVRLRKLGDSDEGSMRVANTLLELSRAVETLRDDSRVETSLRDGLAQLATSLQALKPQVSVGSPDLGGIETALRGMTEVYERVLAPLVSATYHKMKLDHALWDEMKHISNYVEKLDHSLEPDGVKRKPARKPSSGTNSP